MAAAKTAIILSLFLGHLLSLSMADIPTAVDPSDSTALQDELQNLQSKIRLLESAIEEKTQQLKLKDETILQRDKSVTDKSNIILSMENRLLSLQERGKSDSEERASKFVARTVELEKQVNKLKSDLEQKEIENEAFEGRASEAESKLRELNLKLEQLHKIDEEQKSRISKIERALKVSEEEMIKAKVEATSRTKELTEVHGAWLPPWLAVHMFRCQSFIGTYWKVHGKPAMDLAIQKFLEKKDQVQILARPHMEKIRTKLVPAVKDQYLVFMTYFEPQMRTLAIKTVEAYEASRTSISPHVVKVQETIDPYFQEAKRFSRPYIDQIATLAKPHVEKVRVLTKPYTQQMVHGYGKFLESATKYHDQVRRTVQDTLKKHELTRALATKELEWFAASAILALPIIILFRVCSAIFYKKSKKHSRHATGQHARRNKSKKSHPDM